MKLASKELILKILGFCALPLIWYLMADVFSLSSPLLFPTLKSVLTRLCNILVSESFLIDFSHTVYRWMLGFSLGVITGTFCGLIVGMSINVRKFIEFPLEFLRSMPVTAIFPLFLIVFGIGDPSKIAMAFTPTFLLMLVNTSYGVTLADITRRRMAFVFGASQQDIFFKIITMDALPQIFVGLRLALSQSLIVTVVSEMFIGTDYGLGQRVYDSYLTNSITSLYAFLIVLGIIGYLINKALLMIEKRYIFWTAK